MSDIERLKRHLRPEDAELIRGYDPTTAGLLLWLVLSAREAFEPLSRKLAGR